MIRPATPYDIPQLLEWGQRFADKARLADSVGYDPASMEATFRTMIAGENYTVLVSDTGAIGGGFGPHPFNHAHLMAQELFWWSEGRDGLRLFAAFEDWARGMGCKSVSMLTLEAVEADRMAKLYEKRGFRPLERNFLKVF